MPQILHLVRFSTQRTKSINKKSSLVGGGGHQGWSASMFVVSGVSIAYRPQRLLKVLEVINACCINALQELSKEFDR